MQTIPNTVAEIGPGASLGLGLCALLSGANKYFALDVVEHASTEANLNVFEDLVELFINRAGRPRKGWPDCDEFLDEHLFPSHILTDEILEKSLSCDRLEEIKAAITGNKKPGGRISIEYMSPWSDVEIINRDSVDLILSHSVLEHVSDISSAYTAAYSWLKQGGWMSHLIDLSAHGFADKWNGHWAYSEFMWKILTGKRPYSINRLPCSSHIRELEKAGFHIHYFVTESRDDGIDKSEVSSKWENITNQDLNCSVLYIQAIK